MVSAHGVPPSLFNFNGTRVPAMACSSPCLCHSSHHHLQGFRRYFLLLQPNDHPLRRLPSSTAPKTSLHAVLFGRCVPLCWVPLPRPAGFRAGKAPPAAGRLLGGRCLAIVNRHSGVMAHQPHQGFRTLVRPQPCSCCFPSCCWTPCSQGSLRTPAACGACCCSLYICLMA